MSLDRCVLNLKNKEYACIFEMTTDLIGGKWKPIIIGHLGNKETKRFNGLKKLIPKITQKILTQQLRELESDKLIIRKVYSEVPLKVEYSLTELGDRLMPILRIMSNWGEAYYEKIDKGILQRKRKRERIKINNLNDFKDELKKEGYNISECDEEKFKEKIAMDFNVDKNVIESLYTSIRKENITYKVSDIKELIDYIKKIILFEDIHNKLFKKISTIKSLIIERTEYERVPSTQDDVEDMIPIIEKTANDISRVINDKDKIRLIELEKYLDEEYLYAKDIELLKKMVLIKNEYVKETYNAKTRTKTVYIKIPEYINYDYIKAKKGSVEYYEHIKKNIPRMNRLIKNVDKYMNLHKDENQTFKINQSEALQDSINIAVAIYNGKEFRAISGSNEVKDCCRSPLPEKEFFKSSKVNKLGKLGTGYNRVNDSEKKIFEEIHRQIEEGILKEEGNLILYSKWEPCPSCYLVIDQFRKYYSNINVQVKYTKKYGE